MYAWQLQSIMIIRQLFGGYTRLLAVVLLWSLVAVRVSGSLGDRLPDFKECVLVK